MATVPLQPEFLTTVTTSVPVFSLTLSTCWPKVKMPAWSSSKIVMVATRGSTSLPLGGLPVPIFPPSCNLRFWRRTKKCSSSSKMSSSKIPTWKAQKISYFLMSVSKGSLNNYLLKLIFSMNHCGCCLENRVVVFWNCYHTHSGLYPVSFCSPLSPFVSLQA